MDTVIFLFLIKEQMQVRLISQWPSLSRHQHIDCFQFFSLSCNFSFVLSSDQGLRPLRLKMQEFLLNPPFRNFILEEIKHTSTEHQWNTNAFLILQQDALAFLI